MIPQITEINFPSYATLHEATISLSEMGDRTITTQVRIDGDVVPDFTGWELEFRGERFILPIRSPQATKDNTTQNSLVSLTFYSSPVDDLKRYFFVEMASTNSGTAIPDKYNASLALSLEGFVDAFNLVLTYYFAGRITMSLYQAGQGIYSTERSYWEINYTHIWDLLTKVYEIYKVRWRIEYNPASAGYIIKVGYPAESITDHDFEYGYSGGLLKFERQVQSDAITNILLGRGGEKNLPYRYFKRVDEQNPDWAADPDAIPELANIYFDRLHDINFRNYVEGWRTNPLRDTSWEAVQTYDSARGETDWAYAKGHFDTKFNPVEYVKDDESIAKYGERWGALDNNDDIYPTIQGVELAGIGRVDETVAVSEILTDDIYETSQKTSVESSLPPMTRGLYGNTATTFVIYSDRFTVPTGMNCNVTYTPVGKDTVWPGEVWFDTENSTVVAVNSGTVHDSEHETEYPINGLTAGTYRLKLNMVIHRETGAGAATGTYGIENIVLTMTPESDDGWKPTFDIWIKNIWQTTKGSNETPAEYATRVWRPILGDHFGKEAAVVFSDGFLSISQDYEFKIASYPEFDQSKTINGVPSEWKLTLFKSDAEFDATGLYIPNATASGQPLAGDHFYFIGIDMPFLYVKWAEERLNAWKTENLDEIKDLTPTWVVSLDKVRINTIEDEDYGTALIDRLESGALIRTKDRRFTNGDVLSLYVQTITYKWAEPSDGSPYLVPDVEIVLSDRVVSVESAVKQLSGEVDVIKSTYAKTADIETTIRKVATPLFLMKTGESDSSNSPTTFSSKVTSAGFRQGGVGGAGWGIYSDNNAQLSDGDTSTPLDSVLEIDKLVVRKEMSINSLVVNQVAYVGGKQIISAASIECTMVIDNGTAYECFFDGRQGSVVNLFQVGDIAYGQVFAPDNVVLRYYKMVVSAVGVNSITLAKSPRDGTGEPQKGDTIVQFGNTTDANRQYVILRDVIGGGYESMLSGLSTVFSSGTEYYFAGRRGTDSARWFVGDAAGQYAEYQNGVLNINGRLSVSSQVAKADGTYVALSTYLSNLQDQIDGNVTTWYESGIPTLSNAPARSWTTIADKNDHIGDLYYDRTTGKAYRFMLDGSTYVWAPIADEDIAAALALANQNSTAIAGLQYLKAATNQGTLVQGGLVLTSTIQLGSVSGTTYEVWAGINGIRDTDALGDGIAAWYGGPMTDHEEDTSATSYAKTLFRFDGSGYLAQGNIKWDENGNGQIPGITWSGNNITIGGNVKLASLTGDSVTTLLSAVQTLTNDVNSPVTYWGRSAHLGDTVTGDMSSVGKISFTPKTTPATSGNILEVVTVNGVTYLHTTLPIVSDDFIQAGGLNTNT